MTTGHRLTDRIDAADQGLDWYLLQTVARQERKAEDRLIERGFPVYVPRMAELRLTCRRKNRRERVEFPMFDGYMFAGLLAGAVLKDFEVEGVIGPVRFSLAKPPPVPFRLIGQILGCELEGLYDCSRANVVTPLERGERVMMLDGPWAGFGAEVVKLKAKDRVRLLANVFGRETPITLEVWQVERLA